MSVTLALKLREGWLFLPKFANVEYVEPDVRITASASSYSSLSGSSAVSGAYLSWGSAFIGTDNYSAYAASLTSSSITVAVVDTGIDTDHPFFSGRLLRGYDFVDNDSSPEDENGHGTMVSGIVTDNTRDLSVNILPVRVLDEEGSGYFSCIASGIKYAADSGAKVINLSLGGNHSSLIDDAVKYAANTKGAVCVISSGNDGRLMSAAYNCPAHVSEAITVGSVGQNGRKSDFSDYGEAIDVCAPGENILSPTVGGYLSASGTSFSAPFVSACAAMVRLLYPNLTPAQVESVLKSSCDGYAGTETVYLGAGCVNMNNLIPSDDDCSHSISYVKKKAAACTEYGCKAHYECSACGKIFSDSYGLLETTLSALSIEPLGHDYSETNIVKYAGLNTAGKYQIVCSRSGCGKVKKSVTVKAVKSVTLSSYSFTYTGKSIKPSVKVKNTAGKVISSEYYTVTYSSNKKAGTATVKVKLKGKYKGTITKKFTITPASLGSCSVKTASFEYTGKNPSVTLLYNGSSLSQGTDFTITFEEDSSSIGTHTAKIKGTGSFKGTKTLRYAITPAAPKLKTVSAGTNSIRLTWSKVNQADGFEIQYSYSAKMKPPASVTVNASQTSAYITPAEHGRYVYIRIRSYKIADGTKIYSPWKKADRIMFT